jgi:hypothetical protein
MLKEEAVLKVWCFQKKRTKETEKQERDIKSRTFLNITVF